MSDNLYLNSAELYDLCDCDNITSIDLEFYLRMIPIEATVLEIGCGTGRISIPLCERGNNVSGLDLSKPMLDVFKDKIEQNSNIRDKIKLYQHNMMDFDLEQKFDCIIFPFRSFQALTSDYDRHRCLSVIKKHMNEESRVIITLFNPLDSILKNWGRDSFLELERTDVVFGHKVRKFQKQQWHSKREQIIASTMRYEISKNEEIIETIEDTLKLGYLYPEQCIHLFAESELRVVEAFSDYKCNPLTDEVKKEQIYILKLVEFKK
jgi:SAM-dependent methyltransferase